MKLATAGMQGMEMNRRVSPLPQWVMEWLDATQETVCWLEQAADQLTLLSSSLRDAPEAMRRALSNAGCSEEEIDGLVNEAFPEPIIARPSAAEAPKIEEARSRSPQLSGWQDIATAPTNTEVFFWCVPKPEEEAYADTSGRSIFSAGPPFLHRGKWKSWGSLYKATHWKPLPAPPEVK